MLSVRATVSMNFDSFVYLSRLRDFEVKNGLIQDEKKPSTRKRKDTDVYKKVDKKSDVIFIGEDFKNIEYRLSQCCNPIPGDKVFGFITINEGIKIHRTSCPNAEHLMSKMAYRCIKASWKSEELKENIAAITVYGIDRLGIVNKLTEIVSNQHNVNMKSISFETDDGIFEGHLKVLVYDTEHLDQLMRKFEQVEGVQRVERKMMKEDN